MKWPRYTRKQNLSCKLSSKDIIYIQKNYKYGVYGYGLKSLAKKFDVSKSLIEYWVNPEVRKRRISQASIRASKRTKEEIGKINSRSIKRKYVIQAKKLSKYNRENYRKKMSNPKRKEHVRKLCRLAQRRYYKRKAGM